MKKLFLFYGFYFLVAVVQAQQPAANPFPKTITVTGSAEMEVIPDQIYVSVALKEYQKKGEEKKDLETLKNNFLASCSQAGIPDSMISIASYTGFNNYYFLRKNKKRAQDLMAGITYQVVFSSSKQMDALVDKLDDEATQSFDITYTSHSRMTEFRKQLKIQAVKAAKDKAIYLTDAIGEKLGSAITVNEPGEPVIARAINYSNGIANMSDQYGKSFEVDFKKIKVRYEVNVIFALQ